MSQRILPQDNADFVYQYATNVMRPSTWQGGGVALVALTWPLAFFLVERRRRSQRFTWIFYVVELLLCAGTLYWLHLFTALGQWLYGAYLVCAAIAIYALASLVLFIGHIRKRPIE